MELVWTASKVNNVNLLLVGIKVSIPRVSVFVSALLLLNLYSYLQYNVIAMDSCICSDVQ